MKDKNPIDVVVDADQLRPVLSRLPSSLGVCIDVISKNILQGDVYLKALSYIKTDFFKAETQISSDTLRFALKEVSAWGLDDTRYDQINTLLLAYRGFHLEIHKLFMLLEDEEILPENTLGRIRISFDGISVDGERDDIDALFRAEKN